MLQFTKIGLDKQKHHYQEDGIPKMTELLKMDLEMLVFLMEHMQLMVDHRFAMNFFILIIIMISFNEKCEVLIFGKYNSHFDTTNALANLSDNKKLFHFNALFN